MKIDVAGEVADCLKKAPGGKPTTEQVKAWLFKTRNNVAVRLDRILGDKAARDVLSIAARRTWRQVTRSNGKAQNLWRRLGDEILAIVKADPKSLDTKVGVYPKGMLASLFPPEFTYREVATLCAYWCKKPLTVKADLIFPYHRGWGLLPADKRVWKWVTLSSADDAVRFPPTGNVAKAQPVPPIGDFVAAMVMNRLSMMVHLRFMLGIVAYGVDANGQEKWWYDISQQLGAVRKTIWDTSDARERTGAMSLLQIYLASEKYRTGFEPDWTVLPWPTEPENLTLLIYEHPEDADLFKTPEERLFTWRSHALSYTFKEALENHPREVVSIVTDGLEWLAASQAGTPEPDTKEQPWTDDAPEYLPLSQARKLIDGRLSLVMLSKLCKPDGDMRYMRKRGVGCKVHIADFLRYMRSRQSDPVWAAAYMNWLKGQKAGKSRLFWHCQACGHQYAEGANATVRCPKCKKQATLQLRRAPTPCR